MSLNEFSASPRIDDSSGGAAKEIIDQNYAPSENGSADELFFGDTGELALDTRRALVQLLSGPSLDGRRHTKLWPVLLRDVAIIRRRLADLFLELVIDMDIQVAFTRQADTGELEVPALRKFAPVMIVLKCRLH